MVINTLNLNEVACILKAEPDKVMQLARSGHLPGDKIGKSWVFLSEDVYSFLRSSIDASTAKRRAKLESPNINSILVERERHGRRTILPVLPP